MSGRMHRRLGLFTLLVFMCSVVLSATPDLFTARTVASGRARSQAATVAATAMPTLTAHCALYPIALHAQSVEGAAVGALLPDIWNGTQPGNFGWLTWTGTGSEAALVTSLTPPGDTATYRNPDNPADQHLSVGDWVSGRPGVTNSTAVRDALDRLKTIDIAVPVWDVARASGSTAAYHVVNVALVRIVDYALAGQDKFVSARFLGYHPTCGDTPPVVTATIVPSLTPSPTATSVPTSTPALLTPTRMPTTAPSSTALPTSAPSVTATAFPPITFTPTATVTVTPSSSPAPPTATSAPTMTAAPTARPTHTPLPTFAPINQRPMVSAGPDQLITVSSPATTLAGTVQDDGLPLPAAVTLSWSVVAGPGTVTFGDPDAASTTVQFSMSGVFHLRLTATDGAVAAHDELVVAVVGNNTAPVVDVGLDRTLGSMQTLLPVAGDVRDDGLPLDGTLALAWQQLAGPGTVTFSTASAAQTTARFSAPGTYRLRLTATDSELSGDDELMITVAGPTAATSTPTATATQVPTPILTTILNSDTQPRGYYNAALRTILDGTQPQFPLANVAGGDPTINPAAEPDLTAASALLGNWLAHDPLPLTSHWSPFDIVPAEWATNTETAVIFPIDAGPYGVAHLRGSFGADNGIFVWVNGVYRFGAVEPRGAYRYEYADIDLGSLHPGINYIQILCEDHGGWTDSILNIQGIVLTAPPADPGTPTPTPTIMPTPAPTTTPIAAVPLAIPGWIGSPTNQRTVTDQVPITLVDGITLTSGVIDYWPVDRPDHRTTLARDVAGTSAAPLATLDTTGLANGSYIIRLHGTASDGTQLDSGVLVTVSGDYKPGRVRFSVTDLTIPVAGIPITVGRTYDSLERDRVGDFGYGWTLSVGSPRLAVDPAHNVTLTQPNGQRVTFYFTPQSYGGVFNALLQPGYTPEAGVYGTLAADGCPVLTASAAGFLCFLDPAGYQPTTYTYTDLYGRVFTLGVDGTLKTITDLHGNTLTFTRDGITSSAGDRHVAFSRGAHDRITTITDPDGRVYDYRYDPAGDLVGVTFPAAEDGHPRATVAYTYSPTHPHLYQGTRDPLGRLVTTNTYYTSPGDPQALNGRLRSVTNRVDATTSYTFHYDYDLAQTTITTTNPDRGREVHQYARQTLPQPTGPSAAIDLVRQTIDVRSEDGQVKTRTMQYRYDDRRNLTIMALPDPSTGEAVPLATDPAICAARNVCAIYDSQGNIMQQTAADGKITRAEHNAFNRATRITDPAGNVRESTYDALGNFVRVGDALGVMGGYTYDTRGNPASQYLGPDPTRATTFGYDGYGNVVTITDPSGLVTRYEDYDTSGNPRVMRQQGQDGKTRTSEMRYNALGRLTEVTTPLQDGTGRNEQTSYDYDLNGNLSATRNDVTGWTTQYEHTYDQRLKRVIAPDGTAVSHTYDWRGQPLTTTDSQGRVTRYRYNLAGELLSVTTADGTDAAATVNYTYDLAGRQVGEADPRGHTTTVQYDAADRPRVISDPINGPARPTELRYNELGRLEVQVAVDGTRTRYVYDVRGFPEQIVSADGTAAARTEIREHNGLGKVTRLVDRNGKETYSTYDALNRLVSVQDALGATTTYTYDTLGQLEHITDALGQRTSFAYDALGRLQRKTWPDQSFEEYSYTYQRSDDGQHVYEQVSHRLPDGQVNTSMHDALGRVVREAYFDARVVERAYTPSGQPREVRDGAGTICYSYDLQDRVRDIAHLGTAPDATCDQSPSQRSLRYAYDAAGNRTSLTTVVGAASTTTSYAYDAHNRLCSVSVAATATPCGVTNRATYAYAYDDAARIHTLTYPNGIVATSQYDAQQQLRELAYERNGQTLAAYRYTLDAVGNRTQVEEADGAVTTWEYDDVYRLLRETRQGGRGAPTPETWDVRYSYDAVGNRRTKTEIANGVPALTTYTYHPNQLNQLAMVTLPDGRQLASTYDARGNLRSDGQATYVWDAADRLISVDREGVSASYRYDAAGRRIHQRVNGSVTDYLWDEASTYSDVVVELGEDGAVATRYILGQEAVLEQVAATTTHTMLPDGQGSTRLLADASGAIIERYTYDAFGALRSGQTTPQTAYLYTGQQFDADTGLYSLRARFYQPDGGRFLSRDTYNHALTNPAEFNRYSYVANNPINASDPLGLMALVEYGKTNDNAEEQTKHRAAYKAGVAPSRGADRIALYQQSVFSAIADQITVSLITGILDHVAETGFYARGNAVYRSMREFMVFGVGTVLHLQDNTQTKALSFSFGSDQLSSKLGMRGKPGIPDMIARLGQLFCGMTGPDARLKILTPTMQNDGIFNEETKNHAEILIARWAIREYQGPPTPHRVLDIATSEAACDPVTKRRGDASCQIVLPTLWRRYPLLFETTVFPTLYQNWY